MDGGTRPSADPPDTGQYTSIVKTNNGVSLEFMDSTPIPSSSGRITGSKRPILDKSKDTDPHKIKQPCTQVSDSMSDLVRNVDNRNKIINRYKLTDLGPYCIFTENKFNKKLHPMYIGKIIYRSDFQHKSNILNISSVGKSKVKILVDNALIANKLLSFNLINSNELETYIPDFNLYKSGVIKNIDISVSNEDIVDESKSEFKIIEARRLTKRIMIEGKIQIKQLETCVLKFEGQLLPKYIYLYGTRCEVNIYIPPVVQCFNCLLYGHMSKQCRSKQRCSRCQAPHASKDCDVDEPKCLFCKGDHSSTYRKCPEFSKQKNIKKIMSLNDLSYKEASKMHNESYAFIASQNIPNTYSDRDFPRLEKKQQHVPKTNLQLKKNYTFTKIMSPRIGNSREKSQNLSERPPSTSNLSLPVNPIRQNPYAPQYHRKQDTPEISDSLKDKLIFLIDTIIQESRKNNIFSKSDISSFLDNLNNSFSSSQNGD